MGSYRIQPHVLLPLRWPPPPAWSNSWPLSRPHSNCVLGIWSGGLGTGSGAGGICPLPIPGLKACPVPLPSRCSASPYGPRHPGEAERALRLLASSPTSTPRHALRLSQPLGRCDISGVRPPRFTGCARSSTRADLGESGSGGWKLLSCTLLTFWNYVRGFAAACSLQSESRQGLSVSPWLLF